MKVGADTSDFTRGMEKMSSGMATHLNLLKDIGLAMGVVGGAIVGFLASCAKEAVGAEDAENGLKFALSSTGQEVDNNKKHLMDYAMSLQGATLYTHEQVEAAQTLGINLGINVGVMDEATRGAIGLSSVLKIDLDSAMKLVAKGYEGNYTALKRAIPQISECKTEEEKHAMMVKVLGQMYESAEGKTQTFGGRLIQLKNWWKDLKEEVGMAIIQDKDVNKALDSIKTTVVDLIKSGKLKEWTGEAIQGFKDFIAIIKGTSDVVGFLNGAFGGFQTGMSGAKKELFAAEKQVGDFNAQLKYVAPNLQIATECALMGGAAWEKYKKLTLEADKALEENKEKLQAWIVKGTAFIGTAWDMTQGLDKLKAGVKDTQPSIEELSAYAKDFGVTLRSEVEAKLAESVKALAAFRAAGELTPAVLKKITTEVDTLKGELSGLDKEHEKIMAKMAKEQEALAKELIKSGQSVYDEAIKEAEEECKARIEKYKEEYGEGEKTNALIVAAEQVKIAKIADINKKYSEDARKTYAGLMDGISKLRETSLQSEIKAANSEYATRVTEYLKIYGAGLTYDKLEAAAAKNRDAQIAEAHSKANVAGLKAEAELDKALKGLRGADLKSVLADIDAEEAAKDAEIEEEFKGNDALIKELEAGYKKLYDFKREQAKHDLSIWKEVNTQALTSMTGFLDASMGALGGWGDKHKTLLNLIGDAWKSMGQSMMQSASATLAHFMAESKEEQKANQGTAMGGAIKWVMQTIPWPLNIPAVAAAMALVSRLFGMIHLKEGGIIGQDTIAQVHRGEVVAPLDRLPKLLPALAGTGGTKVAMNNYFYGNISSGDDVDSLTQKISDRLQNAISRGRK